MSNAESSAGSELDLGVQAARKRLRGLVLETPLVRFELPEARLALRLKLENQQITGAFKARGAANQVAALLEQGRPRGVVTSSSGNHGKALAWAAQRVGLPAIICMPSNAYSSKIEACRGFGAEVRLFEERSAADSACAALGQAGWSVVPPYDARLTLEGQGTLALEVLEQAPDLELLVCPVGGGGLLAGCALAVAAHNRRHPERPPVRVYGVEPAGAASMQQSLAAGQALLLERLTSKIQGLTPPGAGRLPFEIAREHVSGVFSLEDQEILTAQAQLVRQAHLTVEPAGAAAFAWVAGGGPLRLSSIPGSQRDPLQIVCVISGGNPEPSQIAALRAVAP